MARKFHLKNGAKEIQVNLTTQNFEYDIELDEWEKVQRQGERMVQHKMIKTIVLVLLFGQCTCIGLEEYYKKIYRADKARVLTDGHRHVANLQRLLTMTTL